MKMILIDGWLALNLEHVASIRSRTAGSMPGVTIEMASGTRHEISGLPIEKLYAQISAAIGATQGEQERRGQT